MRFHSFPSALPAIIAAIIALPLAAHAVVDNEDSLYVAAGETYTLCGEHVYDEIVQIESTGVLYVTPYDGSSNTGRLSLDAPWVVVEGTIDGDGRGYRALAGAGGEGPGGNNYPGAGGGYGGTGGAGGWGNPGGTAYGTMNGNDVAMGSAGGATSGADGGNGGAAISIYAQTIFLLGTVTARGEDGEDSPDRDGGGGGAGGCVLVSAESFATSLYSRVRADGGAGGDCAARKGGGGGAGGRIKFFLCDYDMNGQHTYAGGSAGAGAAPGQPGGQGTYAAMNDEAPRILSITDIGNDQGRNVRLSWERSCADQSGETYPVTHYAIYRRIDALPMNAADAGARNYPPGDWDFVMDVPARGETRYNAVVPTLADSNDAGTHWSVFFVSGRTDDPFNYSDSWTDSGYSIDNLSPAEPAPFTAHFTGGVTYLHWSPSAAPDFEKYHLHRGDTESFVPDETNRIAAQADTGYADPAAGKYYKLAAYDWNGNRSSFALLGPEETVGVEEGTGLPAALRLFVASPVRSSAAVRFSLPNAAPAKIDVFDVAGRLRESRAVSGRGEIRIGEDARLPSGVYFIRLTQGARTKTVRTVLVR